MAKLYSDLGVPPDASSAAIKAGYYSLVKRYHPDAHAGETAEQRIRDINHAYEILGDPVARVAYDLLLERERLGAQTRFWKGIAAGAVAFALTFGSVPLLVLWQQSRTMHQETTVPAGLATNQQAERTHNSIAEAALPGRGEEITPARNLGSFTTQTPRDVADAPGATAGREPAEASANQGRQPERSQDDRPMLALSDEAHDESRAFSAPPQLSVKPPPLSSETARALQRTKIQRLVKWQRALAKIRRNSQFVARPAPGNRARNYQELRKYVLNN
jgi:curved DNA-binding protein CbpA